MLNIERPSLNVMWLHILNKILIFIIRIVWMSLCLDKYPKFLKYQSSLNTKLSNKTNWENFIKLKSVKLKACPKPHWILITWGVSETLHVIRKSSGALVS